MTENTNISPYKQAQQEGIPFVQKLKQMAEAGDQDAQEALDKFAPTGEFDEDAFLERNSELVRKFAWDVEDFKRDAMRTQEMAIPSMFPDHLKQGAQRIQISYDIIYGKKQDAPSKQNQDENNNEETEK